MSKVLKLATQQAASDMSAAVFKQWRAAALARTGHAELDCYLDGRPLPVQVTTRYVAPPPDVLQLDADGMPVRDKNGAVVVLVPSDPKAIVVDATVEAMQGAKVDIGAGKLVTIDVSAAVVVP